MGGPDPDLAELYHELILDHGKRPRNRRVLQDANRQAEGFNPLCGDRVHVYLRMEGDRIAEASFEGHGCAICMASASLMTQQIADADSDDAHMLFRAFQQLVTDNGATVDPAGLGKLMALAGVRRFPMRVKCATLPWHTMKAALETDDAEAVVTTE